MERLKQEVTSVTLVNNVTKTIDTVVPQGERWFLLNVKATNPDDVVRDLTIALYKEAAKTNKLRLLLLQAALAANAAKEAEWPSKLVSTNDSSCLGSYAPIVLDAGNTISVIWTTGGASTGATDADGLVVEYLKVEI